MVQMMSLTSLCHYRILLTSRLSILVCIAISHSLCAFASYPLCVVVRFRRNDIIKKVRIHLNNIHP